MKREFKSDFHSAKFDEKNNCWNIFRNGRVVAIVYFQLGISLRFITQDYYGVEDLGEITSLVKNIEQETLSLQCA